MVIVSIRGPDKMSEIVETDGIIGGKPRIEGTRVSAEQVYEMHVERGMSPEEIAEILTTVTVEGAEAAIRYMEERSEQPETASISA